MVLRFRDLVAKTIEQHGRLIQEHGFVWWGWWNKPEERVPRTTFQSFTKSIQSQGQLSAFLADSGNRLLFGTAIKEIKFPDAEGFIDCPDPEKTPTYYSKNQYKAWFKLISIEQIPIDEIRKWTYDEVQEFLDDPTAESFQDKRVFNLAEMLERRHRTIYFVRPFREGDRDVEVRLIPAIGPSILVGDERKLQMVPPVALKDFITTPIIRDTNYVVHLSDLHFSDTHHGFGVSLDDPNRTLVQYLRDDIHEIGGGKPPAAVLITGDFTWTGQKSEFDRARSFIQDLQSVTGLEDQHFVVVPGNHDICWATQNSDEFDPSAKVNRPKKDAEENYRKFISDSLQFAPNSDLSMGRRYLLGNYVSLDIVGLNSCTLERRGFAGLGYVGYDQLKRAATAMDWRPLASKTKYRFLALHHHLIPVSSREEISTYDHRYSLTIDSGQIVYVALELQVDLIAHGHMHQPFSSDISRTANEPTFPAGRSLCIHCAGSAGVGRADLGAIGRNSYSVYEFDDAGITLTVRSIGEAADRFQKSWSCRFDISPQGGLRLVSKP